METDCLSHFSRKEGRLGDGVGKFVFCDGTYSLLDSFACRNHDVELATKLEIFLVPLVNIFAMIFGSNMSSRSHVCLKE